MLLQFRFQNFKSFRDDTILDLTATKITEHRDHVTEIGGEKVLPAAAIYGANASGKSNVIQAFNCMRSYVLHSLAFSGFLGNDKDQNSIIMPFAFDRKSLFSESLFEVSFSINGEHGIKFYNYGFTIKRESVTEEWLNVKTKTASEYKFIFYRGAEELDLSGIETKKQENLRVSLEKETLLISLGARLRIEVCKQIYDWFYTQEVIDFGDPDFNARLSRIIPEKFAESETVRQNVVRYFASFDTSIIGFHVEELERQAGNERRFNVYALHRVINSDNFTAIPLGEESSGTLKMFALYSTLQNTLEKGGIFFVDELNARLHPLLMRSVLISFLDPEVNRNHAQIVFTTHNTLQLSDQLLRRDEIWFTEKNDDGVSSLYSLADFVDEDGDIIHEDENIEKNYLLGKYGAIPSLKHLFGEK